MPSNPLSLSEEAQAKLTMLDMREVRIEFEEYKRLGWTVYVYIKDLDYFGTHFDAPTADECVMDAFDYCVGVWNDKS